MGQEAQTGELRDADIHFISLVDKAANGRQFRRLVFKSADANDDAAEPDTNTLRRMWQVLKSLFGGGPAAEVAKVEDQAAGAVPSFAEEIGRWELEADLDKAHWLLREVMTGILASEASNKADLIGKAIDEYKAFVLGRIERVGLAKALEEVKVQKVGRKMAKDRLTKLTQAIQLLQEILAEVQDPEDEEANVMDRDAVQRLLDEAVAKAVAPLKERLDRLEAAGQANAAMPEASQEAQSEPLSTEAVAKMVEEAVAKAVKPLEERLSVVEKARIGNAAQVDVTKGQVDGNFWGGVFLGG